jgi:protease I
MRLDDQQVAVFVADGFEDLEFWVTVMRLREEGARVTVAGLRAAETHTGKHCLTAVSDVAAADLCAQDFNAVVVPGGWAPDKLRRYTAVTGFVRKMFDDGKVVGQICHAGLVGISAGIVAGRRATGSLGIKDDLVNAGAIWEDVPALQDGNLVWGRVVEDIPAFCHQLVTALEQAGPR